MVGAALAEMLAEMGARWRERGAPARGSDRAREDMRVRAGGGICGAAKSVEAMRVCACVRGPSRALVLSRRARSCIAPRCVSFAIEGIYLLLV